MATARARGAATPAGFADRIPAPPAEAAVAAIPPPSTSLLLMQSEVEARPRRRTGREAAAAGLGLLSDLQASLLGGRNAVTDEALASLAGELDAAALAAEPGLARLCRSVSLRLQVEIAKRSDG